MLRFLATSDIHDNVAAVQKLRLQEENRFDAVIVAGDIGSNNAQEIFDILSTFGCPVLYIYGNWDHEHEYERSFGPQCHHLHLSAFKIEDVIFAGFSGCDASWGQNPIAKAIRAQTEQSHGSTVMAWNVKKEEIAARKQALEAEHQSEVRLLMEALPKKPHKRKVATLEKELSKRAEALSTELLDFEKSQVYQLYLRDARDASDQILVQNRKALQTCIAEFENRRAGTVVVTHDRIYRTQIDFDGVPVFLFGHRHGFAHSLFKGVQYINVSVLDRRVLVRPRAVSRGNHLEQLRNLNMGNYAVMEWTKSDGFSVKRIDLLVDENWKESWQLDNYMEMRSAPCLPY